MIEKIGHIKNPLTVISMFAAIAEISGTAVLPFISSENQSAYIWFLMLFPTLIVILFFWILNSNHKVLYAPSDYRNEENFVNNTRSASSEQQRKKIAEEVKEIEEDSGGKANLNEFASPTFTSMSSKLVTDTVMAEQFAINTLSSSLSLDFKANVNIRNPQNSDWVNFDAVATFDTQIHAAEIKLFKSKHVDTKRFQKTLDNAQQMQEVYDKAGAPKFMLHIVAVIDNNSFDISEVRSRISDYLSKFKVNSKLHIYKMSDIANDYQKRT
ncbi:hypothetical protein [Paraglaciecola sp.]|uniref:hypothetical protein n=1 Tax=Paraglaciecola sp. TaxID=1920173 RepID=UPI0032631599